MEDIKDARLGSQFGILGKAQLFRDTIGRDKTYAENVGCQTVRVFTDHLYRAASILLEYLRGIA